MRVNTLDIATISVQNENKASLKHTGRSEEQKLKAAAEAFESFFISMLFEKMQKTTGGEGLFGKGTSGEIYSQLFNQALGDQFAKQNGIGVAKMLLENLHKKEARSAEKAESLRGEEGAGEGINRAATLNFLI